MMIWYDDHLTGWGYAVMTVGMLAFWGLTIAGIVLLLRYLAHAEGTRTERQDAPPRAAGPTAEEVLAERFARGDIDEEEYHRRLQTLRSTNGRPANLSGSP